MDFPRASGILLHPTSLPGPYGIGDLGDAAYRFVDDLCAADQTYWQILPLGPTGYGDSPYQCFSSFAGNTLLISPQRLLEEGLLDAADLASVPPFSLDTVDFGWVIPWKAGLLRTAFQRFQNGATPAQRDSFYAFCQQQAPWLDDYALFMTFKEAHDGAVWSDWERPLTLRDPAALADAKRQHLEAFQAQQFYQWVFSRQWNDVREYAHKKGIQIIGDVPIFVAYDSADVWANPHFFFLDENGRPSVMAGVPPDYFSPTGQLWGNPLYRWDAMAASSYAWWVHRIKSTLNMVDVLRIDHFRGFVGNWEVPAGETTAVKGRWVKGPGAGLFQALQNSLGRLPLVAEDLGVITPEVVALREQFALPGMKVLQFAFGSGPANEHLPHNHQRNTLVYTGTHDNDTTLGFFASKEASEDLAYAARYMRSDGRDIVWDVIRAAWGSVAHTAIVPLQDVLSLGGEARFNFPSRPSGNWGWRCTEGAFTEDLQKRLADLTWLYGRKRSTP